MGAKDGFEREYTAGLLVFDEWRWRFDQLILCCGYNNIEVDRRETREKVYDRVRLNFEGTVVWMDYQMQTKEIGLYWVSPIFPSETQVRPILTNKGNHVSINHRTKIAKFVKRFNASMAICLGAKLERPLTELDFDLEHFRAESMKPFVPS